MNIGTLRDARLIYLATPYSKFPGGIDEAYREAARLTAKLLLAGLKVYSPIAHTHPVAIYGGLDPVDHSIWMPFDAAMMDASSHLLVAMMPSWRQSYGITLEIEAFMNAGKPVLFLDPDKMVIET